MLNFIEKHPYITWITTAVVVSLFVDVSMSVFMARSEIKRSKAVEVTTADRENKNKRFKELPRLTRLMIKVMNIEKIIKESEEIEEESEEIEEESEVIEEESEEEREIISRWEKKLSVEPVENWHKK
jgi:hypothetical protein